MDEIVLFYPEGHEAHFEKGHPERPERIEVIKNALSKGNTGGKMLNLSEINLTEEFLGKVHSAAYLNLLELTCRRGGHLDQDTYTTPASYDIALRTASGAATVASAVWERKSRCGFALTRPPGHHAMRGQGMGFCLLNNIAIAAEYLFQCHRAKKLAIIDLDLHHGNGTQEIFWSRNDVFYVSVHQSPYYPGTGAIQDTGSGDGEGWTANFPIPPGSGDSAFISIMDELILPLLDRKHPEMVLVSYGFDHHWLDPLGQLILTAAGSARVIKKLAEWSGSNCEGRIALFLEGGYDLNAAAACSLAVTSALIGEEWNDPYPCPYEENNAWYHTMKKAREVWNL